MPVKNVIRTPRASQYYKNVSYETLVASWLSRGGWEVLMPLVDHGKKTDLVVADDSNYYRIQIKTVETTDENAFVENKWGAERIDFVIYFCRSSQWGYIAPAFKASKTRLNASGHIKFSQSFNSFLKAFKKI